MEVTIEQHHHTHHIIHHHQNHGTVDCHHHNHHDPHHCHHQQHHGTVESNHHNHHLQHHHHHHKLGLLGSFVKKLKKKGDSEADDEEIVIDKNQEDEYIQLGNELMDTVYQMHQSTEGWKVEKGDNPSDGIVHSTHLKKPKKKIYRLEGDIDFNAKYLWEECAYHLEENSSWNPTLLESRVLYGINENTDIAYTIAAGAAGGLVAPRDFVNVRRWEERDGAYYSLVSHTLFSGMPHQKKYVRGENGAGGFIFIPSPDDPNKCRFVWYLNTNLKGWLPQHAIDIGLTGVMFDYLKNLRAHVADLRRRGVS